MSMSQTHSLETVRHTDPQWGTGMSYHERERKEERYQIGFEDALSAELRLLFPFPINQNITDGVFEKLVLIQVFLDLDEINY